MSDTAPIYNLKAVTREVGLSPATLRAWERRYGLLKPQRSAGGHRLYSRQDIELLKWLVERQKEGLSISSAFEMWKDQQKSHSADIQSISIPTSDKDAGETILDEFRTQWIEACLVFNDQAANHVLDQAFVVSAPELILTEVLQKGLARIGEQWLAGTASTQQEHFASAIAIRRINALFAACPLPTHDDTILVACPSGEEHEFVLLMVSYLLRRNGWDVVYLGSNVPLDHLDTTIQSTAPAMVVSSAQMLHTAASLRLMADYLNLQGIPLAYGGSIFTHMPEIIDSIAGYYLGTDIAGIARQINHLIITKQPIPAAQPISSQYNRLLNTFSNNEAAIIAQVESEFHPEMIKHSQLDHACKYLSQSITAALTLGDIQLIYPTCDWLEYQLHANGLSTEWVKIFFKTYQQVSDHILGEDSRVITDQLIKYA
jgi:DNA-binding transcriptional MerR regulator/methylmalonyl-CoA mutase cobalamin-binding subunit